MKEKTLPEDFSSSIVGEVVQAACLAHDIGNPAFGHAAEEATRAWFTERLSGKTQWKELLTPGEIKDLTCFDGNAMAFRVVTQKEFYAENGGMRLTYATLGALLKYPWTSHFAGPKKKFSCFKAEHDYLCQIAGDLGLPEKSRDKSTQETEYARHPLAYLVEAADDICYHVLDIEDAIELRLLPDSTLKERFTPLLDKDLNVEHRNLLKSSTTSWRVKNGLLRGKMVGRMVKEAATVFTDHYASIMGGRFNGDLFSEAGSNSLCHAVRCVYDEGKFSDIIRQNERNIPMELGAYSVMDTLLSASIDAAHEIVQSKNPSHKTEIVQRFLRHDCEGCFEGRRFYEVVMAFLDYVTGMTDDYATLIHKRLLGLGN